MKPSSSAVARGAARPARSVRTALWSVPVGLQLSVIYALLLSAVLALLGWALYSQLNGFLLSNTVERLQATSQAALSRTLPPRTDVNGAVSLLVRDLTGPDSSVAVRDGDGNVIQASVLSSGEPVEVPDLLTGWSEQLASGKPLQWVVETPGADRRLVLVTPLVLRTGDRGGERRTDVPLYLQQTASLGSADAILNQLRLYIVLGIVVGTVIGVVAGLALTRAVLRPLDRMANTAQAIAEGDLSLRVNLPEGSNEVARLGGAFDHMVGRLGSALESQRRFVADASHELRTPLTSLEGLSEMLLMGADRGDTGVVQRTVRSMYSELGRLGRLVADLLTLSRLDSTSPVMLRPLDAGRLAADVVEQMRPVAESREVEIAVHCPAPVEVRGDPDRLKQVLLNLVDNALRYTPPGGRVLVSVGSGQVQNGHAVADHGLAHAVALLSVSDTGPGIAPEDQPRIFDRFYRGDLSRARASGNTGLGLAIVKAIVQAHGGAIEVRSTPGQGATFTITLPKSDAPLEGGHAQPQQAATPEVEAVGRG